MLQNFEKAAFYVWQPFNLIQARFELDTNLIFKYSIHINTWMGGSDEIM